MSDDDSRTAVPSGPDDAGEAAHVAGLRSTYDDIATHFAKTREYAWPEVEDFVEDAPTGRVGLDLGCGNGRHAELLATRVETVVGLDVSSGLLDVARERATDRGFADRLAVCQADAGRVPLRSGVVDLAVYVATLHHLAPRGARRRSLDELARVLAPGGRALVSVWCTDHDRFDRETGFDTTVDWTLPGGETVPRFYHVYDLAEFRADLDASDLAAREVFVASGNCYAVVEPGERRSE